MDHIFLALVVVPYDIMTMRTEPEGSSLGRLFSTHALMSYLDTIIGARIPIKGGALPYCEDPLLS